MDFALDPATPGPHRDVVMSLVYGYGITGPDVGHIRSELVEPYRQAKSKTEDIEVLLSMVGRCADNRHPFSNVSVPLTTGPAFIELIVRRDTAPVDQGQVQVDRKNAVAHNRWRAYEAPARLRAMLFSTIITPSCFADAPAWEQADYHPLWIMVIEQYAEKIFFLGGRQYSVGYAIEFGIVLQLRLPMLTNHLAPLDAATDRRLVLAAINDYAAARLNTEALRITLSGVKITANEVQYAWVAD